MYVETLGNPLCIESRTALTTENKVCGFIETYMPQLWKALEAIPERRSLMVDYRNGLVHQMFMKDACAIHEDKAGTSEYVVKNLGGSPVSINIDRLVPEFRRGIDSYERRLASEVLFRGIFVKAMLET